MIPSECGRDRAGRGEVGVEQRRRGRSARRPPSRAGRGRARTAAAGRRASSGRAGARCRRAARRPRRAPPTTASVRGVAFGMGEGRGVHDDAGHQVRRRGRRRPRRAARRAGPRAASTISHVAAAARVDPVGAPRRVVRGVVVDDDPRQRARTDRRGGPRTAPTRSSVAAVGDDEQVVVDVGLGVGPGALDAGHEVVERRHRVGEDRRSRGRRSASTSRQTASVDAERVRVGVLVADRQHAPGGREPLDDGVGHGRRATARGRSSASALAAARCGSSGPAGRPARRRAARLGGPRPAGRRLRVESASPSWRQPGDGRRQRLAVGGVVVRDVARLELVEELQDARAALERVVELEVELRDALDPQPLAELVADERHRPAQRGERRLPLLGLADDADPDLGMAQVRRRLDAR